jgi:hypothetical protein
MLSCKNSGFAENSSEKPGYCNLLLRGAANLPSIAALA